MQIMHQNAAVLCIQFHYVDFFVRVNVTMLEKVNFLQLNGKRILQKIPFIRLHSPILRRKEAQGE